MKAFYWFSALSLVLPVISIIQIDDKPLLDQLTNFPKLDGKGIDLTSVITDYRDFSFCLLQDEGTLLEEIEKDFGPQPGDILKRVFREWIIGKGKLPVEWGTLIGCLEEDGYDATAKALRKEIKGGDTAELDLNLDPDHRTKVSVSRQDESYPIKKKADLLTALREVGGESWRDLCEHLDIDEAELGRLDRSSVPNSQKKDECLTNYFDNHGPDWSTVVTVIADYPINNVRLACKIAKKYMEMDAKECNSMFRHSRDEL